jgi:hypothetical protein
MSTVFVNCRGVVHAGSGGMNIVFPDVCKTPTPGGPIPLPYPNTGKSADTAMGPPTVKIESSMPMTKDAKYPMTTGDEAGSAGGVISGVIKGEAEFMLYSFDVQIEGKNACRFGDTLFHNKKNAMG